ncbi:MAG: hypothetical protein ABR924_12750, partial [Terracidiphilus sp.]
LWVDQGWAVAAAGMAWSVVRFHTQIRQALPVVCCCLLGGGLAGVAAARVKKHLQPAPGTKAEERADG